jgi:hypothetical protein
MIRFQRSKQNFFADMLAALALKFIYCRYKSIVATLTSQTHNNVINTFYEASQRTFITTKHRVTFNTDYVPISKKTQHYKNRLVGRNNRRLQ